MSQYQQVLVEYDNKVITIALTSDEYERATQDDRFLKQKVEEWISSTHQTVSELQTETSTGENETQLIWSAANVKLLLEKYRTSEEEFSAGTKRHITIWGTIAAEMELQTNVKVTATQCQTKVNGLKRTYKNIKDHNKKSGNNRVSWPFFEDMDEIFGKKGWVAPVALASEQGPFQPISGNASNLVPSASNSPPGSSKSKDSQTSVKKAKHNETLEKLLELKERYYSNKEKKKEEMFRKLIDLRNKQHEEKMELLKTFLTKNDSS